MKTMSFGLAISGVSLALLLGTKAGIQDAGWTDEFPLDPDELTSTGRNPYFVLEPGYRLILEDGALRLTITVLAETKRVAGVETRVVEERETNNGALVEVSRNYFAISKRSNSVFYFGEAVDMYENGRVTTHEGSWEAGKNGARFGLMMPGLPLLGARYYQEIAARVAMDRARIVSLTEAFRVPAGAFTGLLMTEESTPIEPAVREAKWYARGVGLVQDGSAKLVRYGMNVVP